MNQFNSMTSLAVLMPSWVGDIVMATPALRWLRRHHPSLRLVAVTRPSLSPLLRGLPELDDVVEVDPRGVLGPWRAGRHVADLDVEGILLLPNSLRAGLVARWSGIRHRIGWARQGRRWLLSDAYPSSDPDGIRPTLNDYLSLVTHLTGQAPTDLDDRVPRLWVTDDDRIAAACDPTDGPYAVLIPGANRADKRWPAEGFAQVADHLAHQHGLRVAVSGSPAESTLTRQVAEAASTSVLDLTGSPGGLGGLKAVLHAATLVISNDTGPRHIAAALGTPLVSLFGPTDHRWTILPGVDEHRLLAEPFLPEALVADRHPRVCRIDRISVTDVCAAASRILSNQTESSQA